MNLVRDTSAARRHFFFLLEPWDSRVSHGSSKKKGRRTAEESRTRMNHVIMANHMISLITSSTTDPGETCIKLKNLYLVVCETFHFLRYTPLFMISLEFLS